MVTKADLTEMVFEGRERLYGAYFLRKKYASHLAIATATVLGLLLIGIFAPRILLGSEINLTEISRNGGELVILDPPPPLPEKEKVVILPPPPPPPPRRLQTIAIQIPVPTPDEELEKEVVIEENAMLDTVNAVLSTVTQEGIPSDVFNEIPGDTEAGPPAIITPSDPDPKDFVDVSEQPQPLNLDMVKKAIGYPSVALDAGIEGQVVVRVLVDEKGNYRKHLVIKKIHPILSEAVEKQLSQLKFTPAIQGNRPIKFWVNIPFRFQTVN